MDLPDDPHLTARIVAKTNEYLDFPSVVGHETPFLDHLARDFTALGKTCHREKNLCIVELGDGPVLMAHVDRHGGIVNEEGQVIYAAHAIKNDKYGEDIDTSHHMAEKIDDRFSGEEVYAYDRVSGGRIAYGDIASAERHEDGVIQLNLFNLPSIPEGTPVAFSRHLNRDGGSFVAGQLDNPVSAAILRVTAEYGLIGTIVFTAEEEIGRSADHFLNWAKPKWSARKDLIVLDTSPFDGSATCLAGAVILRRRDATAVFDEKMVACIETAASSVGAPIIFKDSFIDAENTSRQRRGQTPKSLGLTELGKIIKTSDDAFTGATLQIPTFNYHTNQESTTPRALCQFARTLFAVSG